jgi:hypothetical protein
MDPRTPGGCFAGGLILDEGVDEVDSVDGVEGDEGRWWLVRGLFVFLGARHGEAGGAPIVAEGNPFGGR